MSLTTVDIPRRYVAAVRESVRAHRRDLAEDADRPEGADVEATLDDLLRQLDRSAPPSSASVRLAGPRVIVWRALYDVVCQHAERVHEDCDDYWHGVVPAAEIQLGMRDLGVCFDLLASLGPPPDAP